MTKVSLVTGIYNGERHVHSLVENVARQTLPNFEWVIVDDGSEDRSADLLEQQCARLEHVRVRLIRSSRVGRSVALNRAVGEASGTYIANQDADDLSNPDRLRIQRAHLDRHPDVGLVGGSYLVRDELRGQDFIRRVPTDHDRLVHRLGLCVPFAHTIAMFRKEAWREAGGYADVPAMVDLHLWISMAAHGWRLAACPEVLGTHFKHADSFWTRSFTYRAQQRMLAAAQRRAIAELGLPVWMNLYPLVRFAYASMSASLRQKIRRRSGLSAEVDAVAAAPAARVRW